MIKINIKEAIKWQKAFKKVFKLCPSDALSAIEMAIVALKMQTPKRIFRVESHELCSSPFRCPLCGADQMPTEFFTETGEEPKEKFTWCPNCGHKLDWSDV